MKNYKRQISLFLYVSLFIVISSFAVLFLNFRKQLRLQKEILKIETNLIQADSLTANLLQIESDKRGFQLTSHVNYLKNFYTLKMRSHVNVSKLKKNIITGADSETISQIDSLLTLRIANLDSGIVVFTTKGLDAAIAFMEIRTKKNTRELLNQNLGLLKNSLLKKLQENTSNINKRSYSNLAGLLILLSIFIMLMLVAARTSRREQQKIIKHLTEKVKIEEKIHAERQLLRTLIDSIPDPIYIKDIAGRKILANKRDMHLMGVRLEEEFMGKTDLELFPNSGGIMGHKNDMAIIESGEPVMNIEEEFIDSKGIQRWLLTSKLPLYNAEGMLTGLLGVSTDFTERKEVEIALHNSEDRYRQIVETAQEGIWVLDENNYTSFVNKKMCEMLEYSREEMMGKQNYYFKDEEGKKKAMQDIERRKNGITETQVSKFITKSRKVVWTSVSTNPIFDDEGKYVGALGMFTDITERKKADEELTEAQKKFQQIFDNTADGIYQSTIDGKFIMVNPSMARIFGYDSPEDLIQSVTDIGTQVYADPAARKKMAAIISADGHVENCELQVFTKSKEIIWVSVNIRLVRDEQGLISYLEGTLENITERKKAEEEILQLNRNLDQFANITAHDLQEPIRMVSGFLGLLDKRYHHILDEQGKSYVYRAKDGADRMSILIKDLLEFSRSANKAAKKEPVDLGYIMTLVKNDLSIAVENTLSILSISSCLPVVTGNQSALYRLFLNLVSNGIKFRKKDTDPEITLTVNELPEFWEFHLLDNGIGVAEKDQPKLFHAFQRLHRREEYPGTGLGLVTCKKIVEMHGGKIWMTSVEGKGTTFHFTLSKTQ